MRVSLVMGPALTVVALACSPPPARDVGCTLPPKYSLRLGVDAGLLGDGSWHGGDCTSLCGDSNLSWACRHAVDAGRDDAIECALMNECQ